MTAVTLRPAGPADLDEVTACVVAAFTPHLDRMDLLPAPITVDLAPSLAAGLVWVVGEPIHAVLVPKLDGDTLWIDTLAVHPDQHGHGLGTRLLEAAETHALAHGHRRLRLCTHQTMHENLAWYARCGFREFDRRIDDSRPRPYLEPAVARNATEHAQ